MTRAAICCSRRPTRLPPEARLTGAPLSSWLRLPNRGDGGQADRKVVDERVLREPSRQVVMKMLAVLREKMVTVPVMVAKRWKSQWQERIGRQGRSRRGQALSEVGI